MDRILYCGEMAEWLKATDCKSVTEKFRWFESTSLQVMVVIPPKGYGNQNILLTFYIMALCGFDSHLFRNLKKLATPYCGEMVWLYHPSTPKG